jgi:hypothetical protein
MKGRTVMMFARNTRRFLKAEHPTSNTQHPTSNGAGELRELVLLDDGCFAFAVTPFVE